MLINKNTFSIGIVIHDFVFGGSERIAIRLANYWAHQGHPVVIFAGAGEGEMRNLLEPTVRLVIAPDPVCRSASSMRHLARLAAHYFQQNPVNACFVPGNYHWPVAYQLGKLPARIRPVILTQISSPIYKPGRSAWAQKIFNARMRFLLRKSDKLIALDCTTAAEANSLFRRAVAEVIPLPALCSTLPTPKMPKKACLNILAAGRLTHAKGFDLLISAFAAVAKKYPAATLTICGAGPDYQALLDLAARNGVQDKVRLTGYVTDIRPYLDDARLFVLSSRREGYGAVILEALAAGRQVITTACTPAARDFVSCSEAVHVVPVGDCSALARAMCGVLGTPAPDSQRLANAVRPFFIDAGGQAYLFLMSDLLEKARQN
ncbi:glycosyltransferase [Acetobacter orleanensis]|uniref:Glycosyl transferase n=1 Tax=Acetobacter orleanensis TaxID=104099 RepID=A0A4Y3TIG6_9PROT|nr:glycosyltransferase [Acetobacter orleanensis]PCD80210.1 glycosyltransferase [Acetobacter orleanensis]GAN69059.1 glycosyl transferase group 1 [Acetobacter orleanensis JCM 7639]GBR30268.1 glycosyltransferase [Acetobacter orleanensis NRIC 0473]GEB81533.1 glycosyl transferase [Acetobacter orleanensis]